jgi:hypothetical protein
MMVLHLCVDEIGNLSLVQSQHLARILLGQVAAKVAHRLPRQVVEKIGVAVVGDVVEVDQTADDVVFTPRLVAAPSAKTDELRDAGAQILHPQLVRGRLIVQPPELERKRFEAGTNLAARNHEDARDVDGLLDDQCRRLRHYLGNVGRRLDTGEHQLAAPIVLLDVAHEQLLHIG